MIIIKYVSFKQNCQVAKQLELFHLVLVISEILNFVILVFNIELIKKYKMTSYFTVLFLQRMLAENIYLDFAFIFVNFLLK